MPESRKFGKREWIVSAVILAALAVVIVAATGGVSSNADYICTRVVEENGDCTNGSWGGWTSVATDADQNTCVLTETEERTYTGTRLIRHTLQYLNRRTNCAAGYTQTSAGNTGGASGFHGGTITSESAACQVVETRRTRSPITSGACAARDPITTTVTTETQMTDGQVSTSRQDFDSAAAFDQAASTLDIVARPQLVRAGETTVVSWETESMRSCTVTGTTQSGVVIDTWTGVAGEEVSAPIPEQTTFTLSCTTVLSGVEKTGSVTVDIIPEWQET